MVYRHRGLKHGDRASGKEVFEAFGNAVTTECFRLILQAERGMSDVDCECCKGTEEGFCGPECTCDCDCHPDQPVHIQTEALKLLDIQRMRDAAFKAALATLTAASDSSSAGATAKSPPNEPPFRTAAAVATTKCSRVIVGRYCCSYMAQSLSEDELRTPSKYPTAQM